MKQETRALVERIMFLQEKINKYEHELEELLSPDALDRKKDEQNDEIAVAQANSFVYTVEVREILEENHSGIALQDIYNSIKKKYPDEKINRNPITAALSYMKKSGDVKNPRRGFYILSKYSYSN